MIRSRRARFLVKLVGAHEIKSRGHEIKSRAIQSRGRRD